MYACASGSLPIVQEFLKEKYKDQINLNEKNKYGDTAFIIACKIGYLDIVIELSKYKNEFNLNEVNNERKTALHYAVITRNRELVNILLKEKISFIEDHDHQTPLQYVNFIDDIAVRSDIEKLFENNLDKSSKNLLLSSSQKTFKKHLKSLYKKF
jgi:ankyrin repeat protein